MRKFLTVLLLSFLSLKLVSQNSYFSHGERFYFTDDSTSVNIILSNITNYDTIVSRLNSIFNKSNDLIISSDDDDNIIINSDCLPSYCFSNLKT